MRVTKKCCVILVLLLFLVIGAVTVGVLYGVGTIGKSTDIDCTVPEELKSQLQNGVVKNGTFLNIKCGNGFSNPHSTRSCLNGKINPSFEDSPAKCQKDCKITALKNSVASVQTVKHGSQVILTCEKGFESADSLEFICEDGFVNTEDVQCLPKVYKLSREIEAGQKSYADARKFCQEKYDDGDLWGSDPRWKTVEGRKEMLQSLGEPEFGTTAFWIGIDKQEDKNNYKITRNGELLDASNPTNPFDIWYPGYPSSNPTFQCIVSFDGKVHTTNNFKPYNYACSQPYLFGCEF